jgi:hypothetical protein
MEDVLKEKKKRKTTSKKSGRQAKKNGRRAQKTGRLSFGIQPINQNQHNWL